MKSTGSSSAPTPRTLGPQFLSSCSGALSIGLVLNCLTGLAPLGYGRLSSLYHERSIWCGWKLPSSAHASPGSTVIVEPTSSHSAPKDIIVGLVVAHMWRDRRVPIKILNPSKRPVTRCLLFAVEALPISQGVSRPQAGQAANPVCNSDVTSAPFQ